MGEVVPAIVRGHQEADDVDVIKKPYDGVSFTRGYGTTGYRVEIVEHNCPVCRFDRMIRRHDVNVDMADEMRYWCLNPNCAHFVSDELSHACHGSYPQRTVQEPAVFE